MTLRRPAWTACIDFPDTYQRLSPQFQYFLSVFTLGIYFISVILPKEINANQFFYVSHRLEIWKTSSVPLWD
jgi:hypothetical protein